MKKKRKKLAVLILFLAVFALLSPSPFEETNVQKKEITATKAQTTTTVYEKAVKEESKTVEKSKPNSVFTIPIIKLSEREYTGETMFSATDGAGWDELKQLTTSASVSIASIALVFLVLMKQKRQRDDEHYE